MRTFDFSPFTRSAIGFDHLFELLNNQTAESVENYPPYDIVRTGEDTFRINLARKVPEAMKPRRIEINAAIPLNEKRLGSAKAA